MRVERVLGAAHQLVRDSYTDDDDDDDDENHVLAQLVTVGHPGTLARVSGSSASDTGAAASSNGLSQASLDAGEGAGIGDEWKHLQDVRQERHLTPGREQVHPLEETISSI